MKQSINVILSGGGTGGHIYPAIAIANELKLRYPTANFLFVGAKDKMEMEKVPQAGYQIIGLWISGIQRKLTLKNLLFPCKLIYSLFKAKKIIIFFVVIILIVVSFFGYGEFIKIQNKKILMNMLNIGNTGASSIPIVLHKHSDKIPSKKIFF